jgi:TRAP-type C4-dicarboxylate transport system permease small subunit
MSRDADSAGRAGRPASGGGMPNIETVAWGSMGILTRVLALAGGAFLVAATVITLVSVIGRYGFGAPVQGDYELVEITCAVGVFLFFPYTHAVDGNITADFFTAGFSAQKRRILDSGNDVIFTLVAILLTWRLSAGLMEKFASGETTILIRIPLWWAYSVAVLSMVLLTIVCLMRVIAGIGARRR